MLLTPVGFNALLVLPVPQCSFWDVSQTLFRSSVVVAEVEGLRIDWRFEFGTWVPVWAEASSLQRLLSLVGFRRRTSGRQDHGILGDQRPFRVDTVTHDMTYTLPWIWAMSHTLP